MEGFHRAVGVALPNILGVLVPWSAPVRRRIWSADPRSNSDCKLPSPGVRIAVVLKAMVHASAGQADAVGVAGVVLGLSTRSHRQGRGGCRTYHGLEAARPSRC